MQAIHISSIPGLTTYARCGMTSDPKRIARDSAKVTCRRCIDFMERDSAAAKPAPKPEAPKIPPALEGLAKLLLLLESLPDRLAALEGRLDAQRLAIAELDKRREPEPPPSRARPIRNYDDLDRSILEFIDENGPALTQHRIAYKLRLSTVTVNLAIKRLVARGHLAADYSKYVVTPSGLRDLRPKATTPALTVVPTPAPQPVATPSVKPEAKPQPRDAVSRERLEFVNHMRMYGRLNNYDDEQSKQAFQFVYGVMASLGMDPRGKKIDGKKCSAVDYLDRQGWAPEARRIALEHFPLPASEAAA